jgi:transposase
MKEELRLILHLMDVDECKTLLEEWIAKARECDIKEFQTLAEKIDRNKEFILNTIRMQMSNARIEATNNKIKLIIRKAFGFRNIQHLIDMIMLICSDLIIQLPNRSLRKTA